MYYLKGIEARETTNSLFIVALRFIGPTAFKQIENPNGAVRCEIFSKVTLPSLVSAMRELPARSIMNVVLINQRLDNYSLYSFYTTNLIYLCIYYIIVTIYTTNIILYISIDNYCYYHC